MHAQHQFSHATEFHIQLDGGARFFRIYYAKQEKCISTSKRYEKTTNRLELFLRWSLKCFLMDELSLAGICQIM